MKLDYKNLTCPRDLRNRFIEDARSIMLGHELWFNGRCWRVTALELYCHDRNIWPDPSVHGCADPKQPHAQLFPKRWYLHHEGRRPPKRIGLDIAAGSEEQRVYCGLLIAGITDADGPARAVKSLVRGHFKHGPWKYEDNEKEILLGSIHGSSIFGGPLQLKPLRKHEGDKLYIGLRKGLGTKIPEKFRNCKLRISTSDRPYNLKLEPLIDLCHELTTLPRPNTNQPDFPGSNQ